MELLDCLSMDQIEYEITKEIYELVELVKEAKMTSHSAMNLHKVDGLPTEIGWYWFRDSASDVWEVVLVFYSADNRLWSVGVPDGDGSHYYLAIDEMPTGDFYGPLTPPEV